MILLYAARHESRGTPRERELPCKYPRFTRFITSLAVKFATSSTEHTGKGTDINRERERSASHGSANIRDELLRCSDNVSKRKRKGAEGRATFFHGCPDTVTHGDNTQSQHRWMPKELLVPTLCPVSLSCTLHCPFSCQSSPVCFN